MKASCALAAALAVLVPPDLRAKPTSDAEVSRRALPAALQEGGPALATVLATRRSGRTFGARELDDRELSQLLWAGQGRSDGHRTAPSAGALYPLSLHVLDQHAVWRYLPAEHALVREKSGDRRRLLPSYGAPILIAITAELAITARKYGQRAERYATLEAGHVAQNLLLTATALRLHAVPIGAFDDAAMRRALELAEHDTPLYLIAVGPP